jgi:hypothetical protein
MNNEYFSAMSEIHELEELLASIPEENVIDRMSLSARLDNVKKMSAILSKNMEIPTARLTFRGKPVLGTHGILADFGAKSMEKFSEAFTAVLVGLTDDLHNAGPIPDKDKNQLCITGTAIGSFGFEVELPQPEQNNLSSETTLSENAMKKIETLFRLSAEGSDDDVAEIISDLSSRAIKNIYLFLDLLVQNEAWCGLEFGESFFRYEDYEQIKFAAARLKNDNIHEADESYLGAFQGILPAGRAFEFKLSDQEGVIRGKIDHSIEKPESINLNWLYKPTTTKFHVMRVGQGKPRYTLVSLNDIS